MVLVFLFILAIIILAILTEIDRSHNVAAPKPLNCPICREQIENDWIVCPRCRTLLQETCPSCSEPGAIYHSYCAHCGNSMKSKNMAVTL